MAKFEKGRSGNPRGRPPGIATQAKLRKAIEKDLPGILSAMVNAAKGGDTAAAKLLLDRALPTLKPMMQTTTFETGETLSDSGRAIIQAVSRGNMNADHGAALIGALAGLARVVEVDELADRIEALEKSMEAGP